jgi:hypothetical protein
MEMEILGSVCTFIRSQLSVSTSNAEASGNRSLHKKTLMSHRSRNGS